jgi:plasmid stabilization system protein ParE
MGKFNLEVSEEAVRDAREAHRWYDQRSDSAGARFIKELDHAIAQIAETPLRWPQHVGGTRRYKLHRFPHLVVYQVKEEIVRILAVQHGMRRPDCWRKSA